MYKQLFWPVYAPSLLFHTGLGATLPVYVLGALNVGASPSFASLIVAIMGIIQLTFAVPAGVLIDRFGDRSTMLIATALVTAVSGVTVLSMAAGPGVLGAPVAVTLYAVSLFLRAPSEAVWTLARQSFITRNVPTHFIGRAMTALGGTIRVGNLAGPLAGAVLVMVFPLWSVLCLPRCARQLRLRCCIRPWVRGCVLIPPRWQAPALPRRRTLPRSQTRPRWRTPRAGHHPGCAASTGRRSS